MIDKRYLAHYTRALQALTEILMEINDTHGPDACKAAAQGAVVAASIAYIANGGDAATVYAIIESAKEGRPQ